MPLDKQEIYLDNSATTAPCPEAVQAVIGALTESFGNPSSLHGKGLAAERIVTRARAAVAALIGAPTERIVFTSGGTEANNLAFFGVARAFQGRGRHLVTTVTEHPSVLTAAQRLEADGFAVTYLPVDATGRVTAGQVTAALRDDTILVSVMHVNNEVGAVQPIREIGAVLKDHPALFHVDAVQSAGCQAVDVREWRCDLLSLSAHKVHGPKGVGALYLRQGLSPAPLLLGGGQEGGLRSGTENVPGIAGFGAAATRARAERVAAAEYLRALKGRLLDALQARGLPFQVNGPDPKDAAPHIVNLSFAGVTRGEVMVHALEEQGAYVSTGSACHSRHRKVSHVLEALGLPRERAEGAIRISLSPLNRPEEIDAFVQATAQVVPQLRAFMARR